MIVGFATRLMLFVAASAMLALLGYLVLPWLARKTPGSLDDLLVTNARLPAVLIVLVSGVATSLHLLHARVEHVRVASSWLLATDVVLVGWLAWRILTHVGTRFAEYRARLSESNLDDVLVPILSRRVLPLVLGLAIIAGCLHVFGFGLGGVFTAIGAMGFLLILVFQEPISNLFSGIYLVVDVPFSYGDLVRLDDGVTYRVEEIGARVTRLYNTEEHTVTFIPNKRLAEDRIANVARPNAQLRVKIAIGVSYETPDLRRVKKILEDAANAHPHVLGDPDRKLRLLRSRADYSKQEDDELHRDCRKEDRPRDRLRVEIARLTLEHKIRRRADDLVRRFRLLARFARALEENGLSRNERVALHNAVENLCPRVCSLRRNVTQWVFVIGYLDATYKGKDLPVVGLQEFTRQLPSTRQLHEWLVESASDAQVVEHLLARGKLAVLGVLTDAEQEYYLLGRQMWRDLSSSIRRDGPGAKPFSVLKQWKTEVPSWCVDADYMTLYTTWHKRVRTLLGRLKKCRLPKQLRGEGEFVYHERLERVVACLEREFPLVVPSWQYPDADFVGFGPSELQFELEFFLDDLAQKHFQQHEDVTSDVGIEIHEVLKKAGIVVPYPQRDIRLRRTQRDKETLGEGLERKRPSRV